MTRYRLLGSLKGVLKFCTMKSRFESIKPRCSKGVEVDKESHYFFLRWFDPIAQIEGSEMAFKIIHFGLDDCHRLAVLKSARYSIIDCGNSIERLHAALLATREVEAIVVSETDSVEPEEAIHLARSFSMAPLVLFQGRQSRYDESEFDLCVPPLTDPSLWLTNIGALIAPRRVTPHIVNRAQVRTEFPESA